MGNSGLSSVIIGNPEPGWTAEPTASLNSTVSYLDGLEADHVVTIGGNAATAVQGWRDPTDHTHYLVVALVALTFTGESAATVASRTNTAAVNALASLCAGISSQSSIQTAAIAGIPASHTLACNLKSGSASSPYAAGWSRANVLALVISTQSSVTAAQMASIATSEYGAMPSAGYLVPAAPGSGSWLATLLELQAGLIVLALAGVAIWRVVQRADRTVSAPEVRRGVVERPASRAGGVGPASKPAPATPTPTSTPTPGARYAASTSALIRSSVVRMPSRLVRPRDQPRQSQ